ncbi:MAG TPA: T9SS type A sorting domain-containing protein [Bacteroidia bacterium]|jgi:hypothetical protein|nr:T9SS type A sorting domain-containing protein [Bacteroidia bacterium]
MKKLTFLSGIALIAGFAGFQSNVSAQITLDQSDLPSVGFSVVIDSDGVSKPSPGVTNTSSAQNWDFSGLLKQKSKTDVFMAPTSTKYSGVFTTANLADSTIGGNGYNFFNIGATDFTVVGAEEVVSFSGNSLQIEINLNPTFNQSDLPATISTNNTANGTAYGTETITKTFSVVITQERVSTTIIYADTVDAYGMMKMPNGGNYNVLRQKHHEVDIDSILVYNSINSTWSFLERIITNKNQYDWYAKSVGYILAEEDMSPTFDTIVDLMWDTTAALPSAINEISIKNNVNIFPDPANNQVNFITGVKQDAFISIYDITGREIEKVAVKNSNAMLNTGSYSNGVYLYSLTDNSGNLLDRGKFVVQH